MYSLKLCADDDLILNIIWTWMYSTVREQRCKHGFVWAFFVTEVQIIDVFAIRAFWYDFSRKTWHVGLSPCIFRCYFSFLAVATIRRYEREWFPNYQLSVIIRAQSIYQLPMQSEKRETTPFLVFYLLVLCLKPLSHVTSAHKHICIIHAWILLSQSVHTNKSSMSNRKKKYIYKTKPFHSFTPFMNDEYKRKTL